MQQYEHIFLSDSPRKAAHNGAAMTEHKDGEIFSRIMEARSDHGKDNSQTAIAKDLGVHPTAVHKWARGYGDPSPKHIYTIAEMEGVCVEWLFSGRGQKYPTDPDAVQMLDDLDSMTDAQRQEVIQFVKFLASKSDN
jgi:ribosome-binding protein aMBF1 (putative translation factor)